MSDKYYVGVDLGTTNSCLAYSDGNGNVKIAVGKEGMDMVPSAILFTDSGKYVGVVAKEAAEQHHLSNVVTCFKRQMGTDITRTMRSVSFTPTELSAIVLTKLFADFNYEYDFLPKKAVITVPGDYGDAERNATIDAARIAGLTEVELINEPIAAALSYGVGRGDKRNQKIIVYDLGGGTFDVTVLSIDNGKFTVLSSEGSKNLGGRDWDIQFATIIQRKVIDSTGLTFEDIESDSDFRKSVMIDAEKQKEALTFNDRVVSKVMLRGKPVTYTVTREELEQSTSKLISRTVEMVGYAVRNANLQMSSIDSIVLVGGSSMMPQVMNSLEDAYPSTKIEFFEPEHAVARGAAIYAESVFGENDIKVTSVLTKSFGVLAGIDGVEKICNVMYRNVPLPIENTLMCRPKRDDQKKLRISIYESLAKPGQEYIDIEEGRLVSTNEFELPGKISRGRTKIPIRFLIDRQGKAHISISCNGKQMEFHLNDGEQSNENIFKSMSKMRGVI